jgi:hypothetical protein
MELAGDCLEEFLVIMDQCIQHKATSLDFGGFAPFISTKQPLEVNL